MSLSQHIRKSIFWIYDLLKRASVRKQLTEVKYLIENPLAKDALAIKENYLKEVMQHALDTVPFYKNSSSFTALQDFPVINKNIIRDNFDQFKSSSFGPEDCMVVSTSGSTGAPFQVLQNCKKRDRGRADNLYFSNRSGYEIGHPLVYIKIWSDDKKVKFLSKEWLQHIVPQNVMSLEDKDMQKCVDKLSKSSSPVSVLSYASYLEHICRYLDKIDSPKLKVNIKSIIGFAEGLNDFTRQRIVKYFGVEPVSRYSNNENGILAQQDKGDITNKFIINSASYVIEILRFESDEPADLGERGRIVVTDLHNYAMPMVRYNTGDVGVLEMDDQGVVFLKSVEGRVLDQLYDTQGNLIPSHLSYKLCKYGEYKQFQLVQSGKKDYILRLNTEQKVEEGLMIAEYKGYFGQDANITIEYVHEIPRLSSGKRREVMNMYYV